MNHVLSSVGFRAQTFQSANKNDPIELWAAVLNINRRWPFFCCHHDCQSRRLIHPKSWMLLGKVDPLNSSFSTKHREDVWCSCDVWPRVFFCSACIFPSCYQRKQCFLPAQFWKSKLSFLPKLTVRPKAMARNFARNYSPNYIMQCGTKSNDAAIIIQHQVSFLIYLIFQLCFIIQSSFSMIIPSETCRKQRTSASSLPAESTLCR